MSVLVLTKPEPNEPLVLIPGFMADARSFMPQIARLGSDRPIILLTPGLGDTLETIVSEIAPQLPARFALVAHGLGGNIAIELMRKRPEAVTRVALIATDPLPETPQLAAQQEALLVAALEQDAEERAVCNGWRRRGRRGDAHGAAASPASTRHCGSGERRRSGAP